MSYKYLLLDVADKVATVTINRPGKGKMFLSFSVVLHSRISCFMPDESVSTLAAPKRIL